MTKELKPWTNNNYSHSYWENGRRNLSSNNRILCFETGYFGLKVNVADLTKVQYGSFDKDNVFDRSISYEHAISKDARRRMDTELSEEDLIIKINLDGKIYRATSSAAGTDVDQCRLWESGKIVQHYDFLGVKFQEDNKLGIHPDIKCTLYIVVWPDSLTFTVELSASDDKIWPVWCFPDFILTMKMKDWGITATVNEAQKVTKNSVTFSLNCNLNDTRQTLQENWENKFKMDSKYLDVDYPFKYDNQFNSFVLDCIHPKRNFREGYCGIREYDEFQFRLRNLTKEGTYVPVLIHIRGPANVTGVCPIFCDENNKPLGVPVQLSKNWHNSELGHYVRFYALIPSPSNDEWTTYRLRIAYGFYGNLPSATHSNLSLIGYNGRGGRWEQLAIGCWGETYCMDVELTCVNFTITDIRTLMCRDGANGPSWQWTDAGWGGDWLNNLQGSTGENLSLVGLKTAYRSQGPCLTEVHYDAWYGSRKEIDMTCRVRTLRTDDYARTFTKLHFKVKASPIHVHDTSYFFMIGEGGRDYDTPNVTYGNVDMMLEDHEIPKHFPSGTFLIKKQLLTGKGPWWISFHGQNFVDDGRKMGKGWRGLVIRTYEASFGGENYEAPSISLVSCNTKTKSSLPNVKLILTPPEGVDTFQDGDFVSFEVELITIPLEAENYYGPNVHFKQHLQQCPSSWKTVHREARGNNLSVQLLTGGVLKESYPIIIETFQNKDNDTKFCIQKSGIGAVPVRFENLQSTSYSLFECSPTGEDILFNPIVHGNDFWQTDYSPETSTYSLTFNIPMDEKDGQSSTWVLKANGCSPSL